MSTTEINRFRRTLVELEGACASDLAAMSPALRIEAVAGLLRHLPGDERRALLDRLIADERAW